MPFCCAFSSSGNFHDKQRLGTSLTSAYARQYHLPHHVVAFLPIFVTSSSDTCYCWSPHYTYRKSASSMKGVGRSYAGAGRIAILRLRLSFHATAMLAAAAISSAASKSA